MELCNATECCGASASGSLLYSVHHKSEFCSVDIKVRLVKYSVAGGAAAIPSFGKGGRQRDPPWIGTNYTGESGVRWEC